MIREQNRFPRSVIDDVHPSHILQRPLIHTRKSKKLPRRSKLEGEVPKDIRFQCSSTNLSVAMKHLQAPATEDQKNGYEY